MKLSLSLNLLVSYVASQMRNLFPDGRVEMSDLHPHVERALLRLEHCFSHIKMKYYFDGQQSLFNHLHADQWATFLYFLSNSIYQSEGDPVLASKAYALNRALHSVDLYYEVELPDIFILSHPIGSVIGRGHFSDYLVVYHHCNVGSNLEGIYPTLGRGVVMFGGSSIIGSSTVGDNTWLSVGSTVMNENVAGNQLVFGRSPNLMVKGTQRDVMADMFRRRAASSD